MEDTLALFGSSCLGYGFAVVRLRYITSEEGCRRLRLADGASRSAFSTRFLLWHSRQAVPYVYPGLDV